MLKRIKRNKACMRFLAWMLVCMMIVPTNTSLALNAVAAETTHMLDIAQMADYVGTTFENGKEYAVTDNSYFTFIGEAKLAIQESSKTFTNADGSTFEATYRFNPGGGGSISKRAIKFTTADVAKVTVYWASGGDGRQMYLLDAEGNTSAVTAGESVKNEVYTSTLELSTAGTYYLCGKDGTN